MVGGIISLWLYDWGHFLATCWLGPLSAPTGYSQVLAIYYSITWLFASSRSAGKSLFSVAQDGVLCNKVIKAITSPTPPLLLYTLSARFYPRSGGGRDVIAWISRDKNFWSHLRILLTIHNFQLLEGNGQVFFYFFAQHYISGAWHVVGALYIFVKWMKLVNEYLVDSWVLFMVSAPILVISHWEAV